MDFYESLFTYCGYQFNKEQQMAISHFKGPALTLAVPGSGKTTLLLARTVCLVKEWGVDPAKILTMTFSKAAANDMEARYMERYYPHFKYPLKFGTIHSFSYRVLKAWRKRRNLPLSLIDADGPSKLEILSQLYRQIKGEYLGEEAYEELSNALSYAKNMMLLPSEFADAGIKFPSVGEIYIGYERFKQQNGLIDFDDMLSETLSALQEDEQLLRSLREAYPYIQVDETQDTSKLQHELIKLIAYPKNNLFVVADDDQSIYGFRGAFPDMILNFEQVYPGSQRFHLNLNYRSKDEILSVCDTSIRNNKVRYEKQLRGVKGGGGDAQLLYFEGIDERNDYLENLLMEKLSQYSQSQKEIGILYRNHMSALSVIDRLMSQQIPFALKDGRQKISDKWLVKDVSAFLAWSQNLADLQAFEKICYRTNARISKQMVDYVRRNHRGRNIFDVMIEAPGVNPYKARQLRNLESNLSLVAQTGALTALQIIEKEIGYSEFMNYATEQMGYSEIGINNLWASLKAIAKRQNRLGDLLDRLLALDGYLASSSNLSGAKGPGGEKANPLVKLSTIHSSKGQEYDTVVLLDVNHGLLPAVREVRSSLDERNLEEDRRLFYVGLSRAKESVYLLHSKFQNGDYISPSPFIKEIEKALTVSVIRSDGQVRSASGPGLATSGSGLTASGPGLTTSGSGLTTSGSGPESPWQPGTRVTHQLFGSGQVLAVDGDRISIGFDDRIRELSVRVCVEKRLLS